MRRPTLMLVAALLVAAAAQAAMRLQVHLDCGTLDGTGRVLVVIDGHRSQPIEIACTRTST